MDHFFISVPTICTLVRNSLSLKSLIYTWFRRRRKNKQKVKHHHGNQRETKRQKEKPKELAIH